MWLLSRPKCIAVVNCMESDVKLAGLEKGGLGCEQFLSALWCDTAVVFVFSALTGFFFLIIFPPLRALPTCRLLACTHILAHSGFVVFQ